MILLQKKKNIENDTIDTIIKEFEVEGKEAFIEHAIKNENNNIEETKFPSPMAEDDSAENPFFVNICGGDLINN